MSDGTFFTGPVEDPHRYCVERADLDGAVAGGEGLVYRARSASTGEAVALKLLTTVTLEDYPRLARRYALLEEVRHPHLMEQLETFVGRPLGADAGDEPLEFDVVYSAAAWIEGSPLTDAAAGASVDTKLRWVAELGAALDHLHGQRTDGAPDGIVHRDVKPSNVRIREDGSAVLVDFGVARPVHATDMTAGVGTYLWRAPEVLSGSGDPIGTSADVWGLGAVAHWLIVGEPPALDGAAAAQERIGRALRRAGHPAAGQVAHNLAELLHSAPDTRPTAIEAWTEDLHRDHGDSLPRSLNVVFAVVVIVAIVAFVADRFRPESSAERFTNPTTTPTEQTPRPSASPRTPSSTAVPTTTGVPTPLVDEKPGSVDCREKTADQVSIVDLSPPINSPDAAPLVVTLARPSEWLTCESTVLGALGPETRRYPDVRLEQMTLGPNAGVSWQRFLQAEPLDGSAVISWGAGAQQANAKVRAQLSPASALDGTITLDLEDGYFGGYRGTAEFHITEPIRESNGFIAHDPVYLRSLTISAPVEG